MKRFVDQKANYPALLAAVALALALAGCGNTPRQLRGNLQGVSATPNARGR